eukprot:TRINITY_DN47228_c0_g1_i1.p1 TRINITY_DN47228_c0_g1~~TRINITY_DN47228_c0_g1_i1.p1  ORF type:complete len:1124 (+),score=156.40 TRINITY_DN47228_c0_g1_i1:51-3374(+)
MPGLVEMAVPPEFRTPVLVAGQPDAEGVVGLELSDTVDRSVPARLHSTALCLAVLLWVLVAGAWSAAQDGWTPRAGAAAVAAAGCVVAVGVSMGWMPRTQGLPAAAFLWAAAVIVADCSEMTGNAARGAWVYGVALMHVLRLLAADEWIVRASCGLMIVWAVVSALLSGIGPDLGWVGQPGDNETQSASACVHAAGRAVSVLLLCLRRPPDVRMDVRPHQAMLATCRHVARCLSAFDVDGATSALDSRERTADEPGLENTTGCLRDLTVRIGQIKAFLPESYSHPVLASLPLSHPLDVRSTSSSVPTTTSPLGLPGAVHFRDETVVLSKRDVCVRNGTVVCLSASAPDAAGTDVGVLADSAAAFAEVVLGVIRESQGQIYAFSSHQLCAAWNAHLSVTDHQQAACQAANQFVLRLCGRREVKHTYGCRCRERWGVGVCSGSLVCGVVGDSRLRRVNVSGHPKEAATALCELCPQVPSLCLVMESTQEAVRTLFAFQAVDVVPILPIPACPVHPEGRPTSVVYDMRPRPTAEEPNSLFALLRSGDIRGANSLLDSTKHEKREADPVHDRLEQLARSHRRLGMVWVGWMPAEETEETAEVVLRTPGPPPPLETDLNVRSMTLRSLTLQGRETLLSPAPPRSRVSLTDSLANSTQRILLGSDTTSDGGTEGSDDSILSFTGADGGRFTLAATELGKGAFGTVRLCLHHSGALYAAKLLPLPVSKLLSGRHTLLVTKDSDLRVGLRRDPENPTRIKKVFPGGGAEAAGLVKGMEIVAIQGTSVQDPRPSGEGMDVTALLRDAPREFSITVIDREHARAYREAMTNVRNLFAEVTMLSQLRSEHVVPMTACGIISRKLVIVMEFASGGSLLSIVRCFGRLPITTAVRYTRGMLRGLELLHSRDIAHRDFKSANVLLGGDGQCKLTDFGCAQHIGRLRDGKSDIVGTPLYLAPEACNGHADCRSDIWSLGIVTSELLTGSPPYRMEECQEPVSVVVRLGVGRLVPLIVSEMPSLPRAFLTDCFQPQPENRPTASKLLTHAFLTVEPDSTQIRTPTSLPASATWQHGSGEFASPTEVAQLPASRNAASARSSVKNEASLHSSGHTGQEDSCANG